MESTLEKTTFEPIRRPSDRQLAAVHAEHQVLGLLYGLLSGLAFVTFAWGIDAFLLSRAAVVQPGSKLLLGVVLVLPAYTFAGWLSARLDKTWITVPVWTLIGLGGALLILWQPIEGYLAFLSWRQPEMLRLLQYPFGLVRGSNLFVVGFFPILTSALAGLFALNLIEGAARSSLAARKVLLLCACIPLLGLGALAADQMVNVHLRSPLLAVNDLLQVTAGLQAPTGNVPRLSQKSLQKLDAEDHFLGKDYQLLVRDFDEEMAVVNVLVLMEDFNILCPVYDKMPGMCRPVPR
ncbi:MAG: hypothetical protein AB1894_16295 [Chloroflexota bacterium]